MKLKVCGMKYNTEEVARLFPDYLGFIFWEPSPRYFSGPMPKISSTIKKVGVFVDAGFEEIIQKITRYQLDAVQLHGRESPAFCQKLKDHFAFLQLTQADASLPELDSDPTVIPLKKVEVIKVFSIKEDFNFATLKPYEAVCDYFLFDTKGKLPGGNGYAFDWKVLRNYPSEKPYFLSGGIGPEQSENLLEFFDGRQSLHCHAIDVNSKFESEPGKKRPEELKLFKKMLASWSQF